ncbi:MAG TPA: hypothetical protein VNL77_24610 [Roseiflexaceae bacterium]|nr:hypothetical protein [Roseiflexaceae bacterium]
MRDHLPIIALVLVFVGLAGLYNALIPLGEAPDEPGHGQYVLFLAREGRLPVQCAPPCASDVPGSGHHPPLAYLLAAPLVNWLPREERQIDLPGNRRFTWAGGTMPNAVGHGTRERWPWQGTVLAWHLARLASTAAGAATVIFTYLAARALYCSVQIGKCRLRADRTRSTIPFLAAALVALNPQFIFISAVISNDALLAALGAVLLWLMLDRGPWVGSERHGLHDASARSPVLDPPSLGRAALVGLVLGLALITKQSALLLAPLALAWALVGRTTNDERRTVHSLSVARRSSLVARRSYRRVLVVALVAWLVAGWWYVRNWQLYGDPLGLDMFRTEFATQPFDAISLPAWAGALAQLYASFWARFGWMNVPPPAWVDWVYGALGAVAAGGLALAVFRGPETGDRRRHWGSHVSRLGHWPLLALPALAFGWVLSFALTAGLVAWQGRMLFPAIGAIAILLARGLAKVKGKRQQLKWVTAITLYPVPFTLLALALWLPFGVIRPAYPSYALTQQEALARLGIPVYGRFARDDEPGAELRGWDLAGTPLPGETLRLRLVWHALGRQNRDWWVFVHLVDAEHRIVAETNAEVGGGTFPMLQWVAGDWMEDTHVLALPPGLAPGMYELRLGLWYPPTGRRARIYAADGDLAGDYLRLTSVTVHP